MWSFPWFPFLFFHGIPVIPPPNASCQWAFSLRWTSSAPWRRRRTPRLRRGFVRFVRRRRCPAREARARVCVARGTVSFWGCWPDKTENWSKIQKTGVQQIPCTPSGNDWHSYWTWSIEIVDLLKMVIFHSKLLEVVSLPEGIFMKGQKCGKCRAVAATKKPQTTGWISTAKVPWIWVSDIRITSWKRCETSYDFLVVGGWFLPLWKRVRQSGMMILLNGKTKIMF